MEDKAELIQCKHCKKPMLKAVAASHIQMCLQKKQDRAQRKKEQKEAARKAREAREKGKDEDGEVGMEDTVTVGSLGGGDGAEDIDGDKIAKIGKKSAVNGSGADKSKKRKADTEGDKEPKKKKTKKEIEAAKPKVPKPKGPVDVEKQCGVLLPNGAHCARSLTCKSHAMGAKRAVPGRSLPYDMLLAAYQKKNQAKQQSKSIIPLVISIFQYYTQFLWMISRWEILYFFRCVLYSRCPEYQSSLELHYGIPQVERNQVSFTNLFLQPYFPTTSSSNITLPQHGPEVSQTALPSLSLAECRGPSYSNR